MQTVDDSKVTDEAYKMIMNEVFKAGEKEARKQISGLDLEREKEEAKGEEYWERQGVEAELLDITKGFIYME